MTTERGIELRSVDVAKGDDDAEDDTTLKQNNSTTPVAADVDEWVFHIYAKNAGGGRPYYELKQVQPTHPSSLVPSRSDNDNSRHSNSPDAAADNRHMTDPLIRHASNQDDDDKANNNNFSPLGWSFQSPFWSLHSQIVLQITYRPAWQAIPEFTNCRICRTSEGTTAVGILSSFGSLCCNKCCSATDSSMMDFVAHTWTTQDIVDVQELTSYSVPGMGTCRALAVKLKPLHLAQLPAVPAGLEPAWERHLERMRSCRDENPRVHSDDNDVAFPGVPIGPTIILCLPYSHVDPPLLSKVIFPSQTTLGGEIAIETVTVFEGMLESQPQEPTHIYLQGFQSWSFTGSVVKGHAQPKPAMPDTFSKAFGIGGSPPPPASVEWSTSVGEDSNKAPASLSSSSSSAAPYYLSDFFTCITSDGQPPLPQHSLLRGERLQEEPFPFQKLDERGGPAVVMGWLSQRQQFGVITADRDLRRLAMHASADGQILLRGDGMETDWMYVQLLSPHSYDEEPLVHYVRAVATQNKARIFATPTLLTGWCSWYHYYSNITETKLCDNFGKLAALRKTLPTNVVVVDDGYMTAWGDWDSVKPGKFDNGMAFVADEIARQDIQPGLWLAPFTADKHSVVTRNNPSWIIRNDFGAASNSGNCGKFFYGLDGTNPQVREHVRLAVERAVQKYKNSVLKIDFLYAACLPGNGKHDLSMSRAQAMHMALQTIRDAAGPSVFLIGCGCPIATGIGLVDGMRISADTGPTWLPEPPLPWWDHGTLPSLRSMIRNSMTRSVMGHRWWHNDPDCLLLGETTKLTDLEVASACSVVGMTCGMLLLSDDLTAVTTSRMRILTKIFPMIGSTAVVLDLHSTNDGLPSLLRLWATDQYDGDVSKELHRTLSANAGPTEDHNAEATFFARRAAFSPQEDLPSPNDRTRSCIHVAAGLGRWTIISISNWSDQTVVLHVPPPALFPPSEGNSTSIPDPHGSHVFSFWSSRYTWLPPQHQNTAIPSSQQVADLAAHLPSPAPTVSKRFLPHETEIFHIKQVTPDSAQYIGSDLHFSCGKEIASWRATDHLVHIQLRVEFERAGYIFVFLPIINTTHVNVSVNGRSGTWDAVGNTPKCSDNGSPRLTGRVIRIAVTIHSDGREDDGHVVVEF